MSESKRTDVGVVREGVTYLYEVAMSSAKSEFSNIIRDLEYHDGAMVKVFCQSKDLMYELKQMCEELPPEDRDRVSFGLLSEIVFCLLKKMEWKDVL